MAQSDGSSNGTTHGTPADQAPQLEERPDEEVGATSPLAADSGSSTSEDDEPDTYTIDDEDYPVHFGRTYHRYRAGSYLFPNDPQEKDRMDLQFRLIRFAFGGRPFLAPVQNPLNVLDIGTGSGIWAIELADNMFPDAQITGIDLSANQPRQVPPNVVFEQQDCSDPDWCRPLDSFDFIFCQSLLGSLKDYQQMLITARKYITPGTGWIECCEIDNVPWCDDNTMPPNWPLRAWSEWMVSAADQAGRPIRIAPSVKRWMEASGYVDVHEEVVKIPVGTWPARPDLKHLGRHFQTLVHDSLAASCYKLFDKVLHWSREDIELFLASVRESLQNCRRVHSYYRCYTVYGRRPSAEEEKAMNRMAPPPLPGKKQKPKCMTSLDEGILV